MVFQQMTLISSSDLNTSLTEPEDYVLSVTPRASPLVSNACLQFPILFKTYPHSN